jgi:hypothetical protein
VEHEFIGIPWKKLWMMGWPSRYNIKWDGNLSCRLGKLVGAVGSGHIFETGLDSGIQLMESMFAQAVDMLWDGSTGVIERMFAAKSHRSMYVVGYVLLLC